jgi:hypothetical protein
MIFANYGQVFHEILSVLLDERQGGEGSPGRSGVHFSLDPRATIRQQQNREGVFVF